MTKKKTKKKKQKKDTTRKPRLGEVDGKDYHFVEKDDMVKEVEEGKFIESATFSGNMYGNVVKEVYICIFLFKVKI